MIDAPALFQQAVAALRRERRASYRLRLGSALGFDEVAALAPNPGLGGTATFDRMAAALVGHFPVALLERERSAE
jgi:hypothetical protein